MTRRLWRLEPLDPEAVHALGWLCFGLGLVHYAVASTGLESVLETVMIAGMSMIVLYTGYELSERPISTAGQWRALLLGVVVAGSFTFLAFALWVTWSLDARHAKFSFLLAFAATLGAAVGTRGSLFAVEANERLAETQELTKLLRINQRVLRHNLRNDLSIALGYLGSVEDAIDADDLSDDLSNDLSVIREHLESLLETSDRTRKIAAIRENSESTELNLTAMLEAQIQQVQQEYPSATVSSTMPAECWVSSHPELPRAIREALTNAFEHNDSDVWVTVTAAVQDDDTVHLTIADTGTGLPETDREAIDLPEETPLAHTQGLGLWILYWTIHVSDGTIAFEDNDPTGTVISITLPRASPP